MARQPGLVTAQYGITAQRYRSVRPTNHEPEQRPEIVTVVNPKQRILQLSQPGFFAAICRQPVDQGQLFCHFLTGISIALTGGLKVGTVMLAFDASANTQQT